MICEIVNLFKMTILFVQIDNCVCSNCKMYLSCVKKHWPGWVGSNTLAVSPDNSKYICPNFKVYMFKLTIVFVKIAKCICLV